MTPVPWVFHVDMDQFLVAVELLRRPELVGLPVVVGGRGDPTERAVVSTASYEARAHGVRSGLALKLAKRRCPDAVFLPVDFPVYEAASARVMETLRALDELVSQGKVRYIGNSNFTAAQTVEAQLTARQLNLAAFASCQDEYSLLRRDLERENLGVMERYGLGLLPYFPLASGLLTGKHKRGAAAAGTSAIIPKTTGCVAPHPSRGFGPYF